MNEEMASLRRNRFYPRRADEYVKCNRKFGEMGEMGKGIEMHSDASDGQVSKL